MSKDQIEKLSEEACALNDYLSQYRVCINRKRSLERRRQEIEMEFNNPLPAIVMDGMPHGSSPGVGCASISYRLDEISEKIKEQTTEATKILVDIMNVIDFLPGQSVERTVIEYKYIDRYSWEKIAYEMSMSRSPTIRCWRRGLNDLLQYKKVKLILKEYEESKSND